MVLLESLKLPMGTTIIDFNLPATDEKEYSVDSFKDKDIIVIIFMCNHCPYVHAIIDRLISIQHDYGNRGIQLVGINSNDPDSYPEDSFDAMREWVQEKGINFVYLHDENQEIAKAYKAQCTPDIYVFDRARQLVYHGRIDDSWQDESKVTQNELKDALDAILKGDTVSKKQNPTIGCSIKWK